MLGVGVGVSLLTDFLFGTSGWSYKDWVGPFYKKTTSMFSHYKRYFHTAEINSTFYAYPRLSMIQGLDRVSPENFVFSAKLPQVLTHEKRLKPGLQIDEDLDRFLALLNPLRKSGKLGCILIQLPPSFTFDEDFENLKAFFQMIPKGYEFAVEFRHLSWLREETWKTLRQFGIAYCVVDEPLLPPDVHLTTDFTYIRWHGKGKNPWYYYRYTPAELTEWIPKIKATAPKVKKIYGYFNNHYHGYAVENCVDVLEMLNRVKPLQLEVRNEIIEYNERKSKPEYDGTLEDFL
jgi:uncharacterized protein YecE (DUF72 family)